MQRIETVNDKQTWTHSRRMLLGSMLQLMTLAGFLGLHATILMLVLRELFITSGSSGFWPRLVSAWGIAIGIMVLVFLLSLALTIPGKRALKKRLLPARCQRCPSCFYDLSDRPRHDNICPECGIIAPRRECVRLWCQLLRWRF